MILPGQTIRKLNIFEPFTERGVFRGRSYGLSVAGYDVRCAQTLYIEPGHFVLASTIEKFTMPDDVMGFVHDKSSWARLGIAVQNTVIEPGWIGYLTLELTNHSDDLIDVREGDPIAQIIFNRLEEPAENPYSGKYQNQEAGPQKARFEK